MWFHTNAISVLIAGPGEIGNLQNKPGLQIIFSALSNFEQALIRQRVCSCTRMAGYGRGLIIVGSFGAPLGMSATLTRGLEQFRMGSAVRLSHLSLIPRCADTIPSRPTIIWT
jgi:hypothetical protein